MRYEEYIHYLQRALRVAQVLISADGVSDFDNDLRGRTCERVPARSQSRSKLHGAARETREELHGEEFANMCTREHDTRVCEVLRHFGEEVRAHDETRVYDRHVVELRVLEHERADDREVDVGRGELAGRVSETFMLLVKVRDRHSLPAQGGV